MSNSQKTKSVLLHLDEDTHTFFKVEGAKKRTTMKKIMESTLKRATVKQMNKEHQLLDKR